MAALMSLKTVTTFALRVCAQVFIDFFVDSRFKRTESNLIVMVGFLPFAYVRIHSSANIFVGHTGVQVVDL